MRVSGRLNLQSLLVTVRSDQLPPQTKRGKRNVVILPDHCYEASSSATVA